MIRTDTADKQTARKPLGIYLHIPFCRSKCPYCDFYSLTDAGLADAYTDALCEELRTLSRVSPFVPPVIKERPVDTVYFGGGTPSYLGAERLTRILNAVKEDFRVAENAEITVECNPSSSSPELFHALKENGVNRISLGMQSAVDSERRGLGRTAGRDVLTSAVSSCREAGIDNISLDIMLGIPGQTTESLEYSLDFALSLGVPHISAYMLKIEEGTYFYKKRNSLSLPDDDLTADMYEFMSAYLREKGMRHYEISNFCFGDKYSRHNVKYWLLDDYLGIGAAAHSFVDGRRFYFPRSLKAFTGGEKAVFDCTGGSADEYIMLSLRLDTGLSLSELKNRFSLLPNGSFYEKIKEWERRSLVTFDGDRLALTPSGFLVSNSLIIDAADSFGRGV